MPVGWSIEYTIAPETPPNLSRAQFLALVRALVDEQIFALPGTIIIGKDLKPSAHDMYERDSWSPNHDLGDVLAMATDLAALLDALERAPYGEQDVCIVFDTFHPLLRGFDPEVPEQFDPQRDQLNAYVALFARPAPRMQGFMVAALDEEGRWHFTDDGDLVEEEIQRPLQHFLVLESKTGRDLEETPQLLAVLRQFYGEPLITEVADY
jgi:hypothetical protein